MKVKQIISVLLAIVCLLSYCSFSVFAEEEAGVSSLDVSTFTMSATKTGIGAPHSDDITSQITTSFSSNWASYSFPQFGGQGVAVTSNMSLTLLDGYYIRPDHEYNISFNFNYRINVSHETNVFLIIYDSSGNVHSRKTLYSSALTSGSANFNFILKSSELPDGYSTAIRIYAQSNYSNSGTYERFQISRYITVQDLDDDVSWYKKIINAIKAIPDKISVFFENLKQGILDLGDKIGGFFDNLKTWIDNLGNNIKQWFKDLGKDIGEFFTMLKNYLLYFQHPVTTNSEGVLIGADGKPVYTNPFENALQKVEDTVYDWLGSISDFLDGIDESRANVAGYLENGSTLVNGVLKASPILSICVTFAVAFLVIRKVVGR